MTAREIARKKSLANLRSYEPGQSGNPEGRRRGGEYVNECINRFLIIDDDGNGPLFTHDDLVFIAKYSTAEAERIAANRILLAGTDPRKYVIDGKGMKHHAGTDPEPGKAFDQIMDRLTGKPLNKIEKKIEVVLRPSEIENKLAILFANHPQVRALLQQQYEVVDMQTLPGENEEIRGNSATPEQTTE